MDANEFLKKVTPAAQRSRLAPFWNDITKLRENNCTLEQVCEFLAANGVQISIAGLSKYIKRRGEKGEKAERVHAPDSQNKAQRVHAAPQLTPKGEKPPSQNIESEEDLAGKSQVEITRAMREREARRFIRDDSDSSNSILRSKSLKEKKQ